MKILIVDDEAELIKMYKRILKQFEYSVESALNGEDAVKIYKKAYADGKNFDCIIMDYKMPIKDGLNTAREILKFDKKAKIIFVSVEKSVEKEVLKLGAKIFLKKPFEIDTLIEAIQT